VRDEIPSGPARPAFRRVPPTSKTSTVTAAQGWPLALDRLAWGLAYYPTHHDDLSN
jgi:hypothetical protein